MTEKPNAHAVNTIAQWYEYYELPIYRYLFRLCGSGTLAQELTQETFLQALVSLHRYRGMSSVSTWLYKIARNIYLNYKRGLLRRSQLEKALALNLGQFASPTPDSLLEKQWTKNLVNMVLQCLPEQYRTVILLKEVENLSHRQISEIIGKSEASTKVLLFRAKHRFKEEYDRLGGTYE